MAGRTKHMKLGGIFVFFLIIVALIPFMYSYFGGKGKFYSAFTDMSQVHIPSTLPHEAIMSNEYSKFGICRQASNGQPCSEGTFCDGATNTCQPRYVA